MDLKRLGRIVALGLTTFGSAETSSSTRPPGAERAPASPKSAPRQHELDAASGAVEVPEWAARDIVWNKDKKEQLSAAEFVAQVRRIVSEILWPEFRKPAPAEEELREAQKKLDEEVTAQAKEELPEPDAEADQEEISQYLLKLHGKKVDIERHGWPKKRKHLEIPDYAGLVDAHTDSKYKKIIHAVLEKYGRDADKRPLPLAQVLAAIRTDTATPQFKEWLQELKKAADDEMPPRYVLAGTKGGNIIHSP